jgi:hypothetical protein
MKYKSYLLRLKNWINDSRNDMEAYINSLVHEYPISISNRAELITQCHCVACFSVSEYVAERNVRASRSRRSTQGLELPRFTHN